MSKSAPLSRFEFSRTEIAAMLGCTPRNISHFVAEGMPQVGPGTYDARACHQWALARLKERARNTVSIGERVQDDLARARRDKIQLEVSALRGKLIPLELVGVTLCRIAALVASQLDSLGPRLAGELADMDNPREVQAALFGEARAIRGAIAEAMRELSVDIKSGKAFED